MIKSLLHDEIDRLEELIQELQNEAEMAQKALYIACSDYYSLHYPNGHRSVQDIYDDYLRDAKEEDDDRDV